MKTLIAVLSVVLLSGCGTFEKLITKTEYVNRPSPELPQPEVVQQLPLEWSVITNKNLEQKLKELQGTDGTFVIYALTPQGYQALSMNAAELRRFIQQQNAYIKKLQEYYDRPVSPAEKTK